MQNADQLRELFRMQQALNERIGVRTEGMTDEERDEMDSQHCRVAMSQEIAELTDSVPWKWWASYQKFDEQNARVRWWTCSTTDQPGPGAGHERDDVFNAYVKKTK
jgi:hypothetical protein